jgi:hypothetical protein
MYFSWIFIFRINFVHFYRCRGNLHQDLTCLPSRASNRQIHSEYFFFTFIRKVSWLIKFETRKCSEVKDLTCFPSAVVFAKTYFTFLPLRVANRQIHSGKIPVERRKIFQAEWRGKFSLKTGIFRKYPSHTWYICLITPNII